MDNARSILVVLTNAPESVSLEEFNRWYDGEHIPERLAVPGFEWAKRFDVLGGSYAFAAAYGLSSDVALSSPAYRDLADETRWSSQTQKIFPVLRGSMLRLLLNVSAGEKMGSGDHRVYECRVPSASNYVLSAWTRAQSGRLWLGNGTLNFVFAEEGDELPSVIEVVNSSVWRSRASATQDER